MLNKISAEDLVRRAVMNSRPAAPGRWPRWVAIHETFALGSGYSRELCHLMGLDPEELINGETCEVCENRVEDDDEEHLGQDVDECEAKG